jgi:hypothetical protein
MAEKDPNPIEQAMGGRRDFNTIASLFLTMPFGGLVAWMIVSKLVFLVITLDTVMQAVFFLAFGYVYLRNFGLIFAAIRSGLDMLNPTGQEETKENYKDRPPDDQGPD